MAHQRVEPFSMEPTAPTRLEPDAIGMAQDTVIGMASSAPAATAGLTLAFLAAASAYGAGAVLSGPFSGFAADHLGRRPVLLGSLGLTAVLSGLWLVFHRIEHGAPKGRGGRRRPAADPRHPGAASAPRIKTR